MEPFKKEVDEIGQKVLGTTEVKLDQSKCLYGECNIGNFINDAFVDHVS